ncbi:hypothetical protein PAXINDRAFT_10125 [Paxillus involutus ATCC 200175]|nr:hypothetical protein PAXINDRAFT_10125 [Paxillus involutus ATCC 200175]
MEEDSINHTRPAPSLPDDPGVSGYSTPPEDQRLVITKMKAANLFTRLGQISPGLEQITSDLRYISASLRQIPAGSGAIADRYHVPEFIHWSCLVQCVYLLRTCIRLAQQDTVHRYTTLPSITNIRQYFNLKELRRTKHTTLVQSPTQMEEDSINHTRPAPSLPDDPGVSGYSTPPEDQRLVITKMKAANLFTRLGQISPGLEQITSDLRYISASLRQIPAGFYVNILVENEEYKTANKPALVDGGTTEWEDHIYLPSDPSSMVELRIYASPELGPMLGRGELLQKFTLSVCDLVQRSKTSRQLYFLPEDHEDVSSWSSLQVTVKLLSPQDTNAIALCAAVSAEPGEPRTVAEATDIGHAHMLRYYKGAEESNINQAITQFYHVVDRCPPNHPTRSAALSNLAMAKFISSQATGAHLDLYMAIFLFQDALDVRPRDHPDHPSTLLKLAIALLSRVSKQGDAAGADEAKKLLDGVLHICSPVSLEYRSAVLVAHTRFMHSGTNDVVDPDAAAAFSSTQSANRQSPYSFDELCRKREQCKQRDDPQLLDDVISQHRDVLSFYVPGQPEWVDWKCSLAMALALRFERQGRKQDLEEAILSYRQMFSWTPIGRANHCRALHNIASALKIRFEQGGDRKDLEEAIQFHRDVLMLRPPGHPDRAMSLNNIANALKTRFQQGGDRKDLEEAIQHHRGALVLRPPGHPDHGMSLNNIAIVLKTRFQQSGDRKDLDEAIQLYRDALVLRPPGHPDRAMSLNNNGSGLWTRFEHSGDKKDLEEAISHLRGTLVLRPTGHPLRARSLNNIASALKTQFEHGGDREDLKEAIQLHRDVLVLTPPGHPDRAMSLNNIASALLTQFLQSGDRKDLEEAIQHYRDALKLVLTPPGHPDCAMSLNNVASALRTQFQHGGDRKDLEEALQYHRDALVLTPPGHPDRAMSLNGIASVLRTRFQYGGDRKDLVEAFHLHRDALILRPLGHPNHAMSLNNIANVIWTWFQQGGEKKDLEVAIHLHRDALKLTPPGHPDHAMSLTNVANVLLTQFQQGGDRKDLEEAIQLYRDALVLRPPGHPLHTRSLNNIAHVLKAWFQQGGNLASGDPNADALIQRFHHLGAMLNQPLADVSMQNNSRLSAEAEAQLHRDLVEEWNTVVSQIRTFRGFSRFLLPPLFSDLQEASCDGPVIVLIASKFSCDAVIVLHKQSPIHIHLETSLETLTRLTNQFRKEIFNLKEEYPRLTRNHQQDQKIYAEFAQKQSEILAETLEGLYLQSKCQIPNSMIEVLWDLWTTVVSPVVVELGKVGVQKDSRMWWCPSSVFTALPLHAAGPYRSSQRNLEHLYVSSYTPSLSTLIKAHKMRDTPSPVSAQFAAIVQAQPAGYQTALYYLDQEAQMIEHFLLPSHSTVFTNLTSAVSTTDAALDVLQKKKWIHFSCHGSQDFAEPFKSSLAMLNGPISLLDIIRTDLSNHEFVYLSACQTAVGDIKTPDEMIHLAAGLQFGGVKSVIGTQWSVHDGVAFLLASEFYKEFCADGVMDCTRAARALHQALQSLRNQKIPLRERIMFIHIGI